jgi:hypothetical protein
VDALRCGEHKSGLDYLRRAVAKGYFVTPTLSGSRQFDGLRSEPAFQTLLADAESGRSERTPRSARPVESDCSAGDGCTMAPLER